MHRIFAVVAVLFAALPAVAQTATQRPAQFAYIYHLLPQAVPTSPTNISVSYPNGKPVTGDLYVCSMDIAATGQQVTVQDRQPSPVAWLSAATIGTGSSATTQSFMASSDATCRWMPNGITISANATGATIYLTIKFN